MQAFPADAARVPSAQATQPLWSALLVEPAAQFWQLLPAAEYSPAPQRTQEVCELSVYPALQAVQVFIAVAAM